MEWKSRQGADVAAWNISVDTLMFGVAVEEKHAAVFIFLAESSLLASCLLLAHHLIWASLTLIAVAGGGLWDLTSPVLNNQRHKKKNPLSRGRVNATNAVKPPAVSGRHQISRETRFYDFGGLAGKTFRLCPDFLYFFPLHTQRAKKCEKWGQTVPLFI